MSKTVSGKTKKAICLYPDNSIREFRLNSNNINVDKIDYNKLPISVIINRGSGNVSREADFKWNQHTISVFCWLNGSAGKENKHELPPPIDEQLYFGDIIVIKHNKGIIKDFTKKDYDCFYQDAFGGFEELGSEDSWSSEEVISENDSIHDFIVSDSENISVESDQSEEEAESSDNESDSELSQNMSLSTDSNEKKDD